MSKFRPVEICETLAPNERKPIPMSEAQLQRTIIEAAKAYGWMVAHFRPAQTAKGWRTPIMGDPGFPDLCMARREDVIFVELKSDKGRLGSGQLEWHRQLPEKDTYIVRPKDLDRFLKELR